MTYSLPNEEVLIIFRREIQGAHVILRLDSNFFGLKQVDKPIIVLELYGCIDTSFIEYSCQIGWAFEYKILEQTPKFSEIAVYNGGDEETITCSNVHETKFEYSIDDWRYKCQWLSRNCLGLDNSLAFIEDLYDVLRNNVSKIIAKELEQSQKKIELGDKSEALLAEAQAYNKVLNLMGWIKGQPIEKLFEKWDQFSVADGSVIEETDPDTNAGRRALIREIVAAGEVAVIPLMEKLSHQNWIMREAAIMMLGHIKDKKVWHPLVHVMVTDENMSIRYRAFSALKRIDNQKWLKDEEDKIKLSSKEKLANLLSEWQIFGETDPKLMQRVNELATKKECLPENIIGSWLWYYGVPHPLLNTSEEIIQITTQDADYLENVFIKDNEQS